MAGLIDILVNNSAIIKSIAKQVGIDTKDADLIIKKLAPILMGGVKANLNSDKDSRGLIKHIESKKYSEKKYSDILDKPDEHLKNSNFKEIGDEILAEITGSKENSREVAKHVEKETGVNSSIIKTILPMLAPIVIGVLTKKSSTSLENNSSSTDLTEVLSSLIDQDKDGSIIDDVMGMATKFIFS